MSNLKERLQQIKDNYAKERGKVNWSNMIHIHGSVRTSVVDEICKRYASEVIKEASERVKITFSSCGDSMTCGCMGNCDHAVPRINKQSILKLIEEL